MKSALLIVLAIIVSYCCKAQSAVDLRNMYYRSSISSQMADSFYHALQTVNSQSPPLLQGYRGMAALMICYHSFNPYSKLKYFNEGRSYLDKAIQLAPGNAELRYLRFSVQTNTPPFLGYKTNLEDDKKVILAMLEDETFKKSDPDIYKRMVKYLLETNSITKEDKQKVKEYAND